MAEMTELAKELKRAYQKEWHKRHKGKQQEYNQRYWEKKAQQQQLQAQQAQ